jgi:hypothetical protein
MPRNTDSKRKVKMRSQPAPFPDGKWRRASLCGGGECVEVALRDGAVMMRSSQTPEEILLVSAAGWRAFVAGVRIGEFGAGVP